VASLFCVALVVVRNVHTDQANFRYLIWNLFLAWIPFVLAVFVYDRWRRRRGGVLFLVLGGLWLLFFPNAPYIATDFVHLQHDPLSPYWYDAVTIWKDWASDVRGEEIDSGHMLAEEAPDATYQALRSFFG
jgi:uncharacterized membrane protein